MSKNVNLVSQRVASGGTGAIALGASIPGFVTFSSAFVDGAPVFYSIRDGNSREVGYGIYNSGPNTITRTNLFEQLVSGIRSDTGLSALDLTVNAVVTCSSSVQSLIYNYPVWKRIPSTPPFNDAAYGLEAPDYAELKTGSGVFLPALADAAVTKIAAVFIIPHDVTANTVLRVQNQIFATGVASNVVRLALNYFVVDIDGTASTVTNYIEDFTVSGTDGKHQLLEFAHDITVNPGSLITGFVSRDGAHANDTYTGDILIGSLSGVYLSSIQGTLKKSADFYSWS